MRYGNSIDTIGYVGAEEDASTGAGGDAPVQSVAGKVGAVTLTTNDVSGLGTAATKNVGTASGNLVELDEIGLPALNGSQLTNLPVGSLFNTIVAETTTVRTLSDADCGKVIVCSNENAITVTIPTDLTAGFNCTVVQSGAGQVTIAAGTSVSVQSYSSSATKGQYSAINIIPFASNSYVLEGDLAASGGSGSGSGSGSFTNTNSLQFDGVDDGLLADSSFQLSGSSEWTVSFWIQNHSPSGNENTYAIFNSESTGYEGNSYFQFLTRAPNNDGSIIVIDSSIVAANNSRGTNGYAYPGYASNVSPSGWNHVAYTNDGSGTRKLYINNILGATITGCTGDFFTDGNWIYGKPSTHTGLQARLDEVALIPSDLSESMADLYNFGIAPDLGADGLNVNPTHWWRMGDGADGSGNPDGTVVGDEAQIYDMSENSNHASVKNQGSFSTDTPS